MLITCNDVEIIILHFLKYSRFCLNFISTNKILSLKGKTYIEWTELEYSIAKAKGTIIVIDLDNYYYYNITS